MDKARGVPAAKSEEGVKTLFVQQREGIRDAGSARNISFYSMAFSNLRSPEMKDLVTSRGIDNGRGLMVRCMRGVWGWHRHHPSQQSWRRRRLALLQQLRVHMLHRRQARWRRSRRHRRNTQPARPGRHHQPQPQRHHVWRGLSVR